MKKIIFIFLLLAGMSGRAQNKFVSHDMHMGTPHPAYPFYSSPYVWWNDSTVTLLMTYRSSDTIGNLQFRIDFLLRDDLETHRRLDSLINEIRGWMKPAKPTYSGHNG